MLYLIRHGATDCNLASPPLLQGRGSDLGLSDVGRSQAAAAAELLHSRSLAAVYSSPMRRARETAAVVAASHGLAVQVLAALTEVDVGRWERRSWSEIAGSEPEQYLAFQENPAEHGYAGGENLTQVHARVVPTLLELVERHGQDECAVIGHNVVNRVFLASVLGLPLSRARTIPQANCGVNVVVSVAGRAELLTLNSVFHLRTSGPGESLPHRS